MTDAIAFHPSPPERAETLSSEQVRRFNRDGFVRPSTTCTKPWHSAREEDRSDVYHSNSLCPEGKKIEGRFRRLGKGSRKSCRHCEHLNQLGL